MPYREQAEVKPIDKIVYQVKMRTETGEEYTIFYDTSSEANETMNKLGSSNQHTVVSWEDGLITKKIRVRYVSYWDMCERNLNKEHRRETLMIRSLMGRYDHGSKKEKEKEEKVNGV